MENLRKFDLENDYLNKKDSLPYPNVSYTKDSEKVWIKKGLSKFYLNVYNDNGDGLYEVQEWYFEEGMTYGDFISSEYNNGAFSMYNYTGEFLYYGSDVYDNIDKEGQINCFYDLLVDNINLYVWTPID